MTTKTYPVTGMSCSHCVQAVTTELNKLGAQVTIDLVPGGTSHVTVTGHRPLPDAAIRHALSKAGGYQLAPP
jgi:copper chaperone CopZ